LSRQLCEAMGIRHCWGRILSLYGPHDRETTLIMYCIRTLLAGGTPALTKGEQRWDYICSLDCARAFQLMAEKGRHGSVYVVSSGEDRALAAYLECLRDCIDPARPLGFGQKAYPEGQVMFMLGDISRLKQDTGFSPAWSFEAGIRATIDWAKANPQPADHATQLTASRLR